MNRLVPILAILLASCGADVQRKDDAPVAVSAIGSAPTKRDPNSGPLELPARALLGATAQGLVRFDSNGQIEAGIAERWIVIDDGRSIIFRLREAHWSDGSPITAAQVVRELRRATAENSRNALAPYLQVIDEIVEMTPSVVEVRLQRPRPDMLQLFAQPELAIRKDGKIGSGPFVVEGSIDREIELKPRTVETAGDGASPQPQDTIILRSERAALALARFKNGGSDLILGGTFNDRPILTAASLAPANIRIDPAVGMFGLNVVRREGFLETAENRAAVSMAIDRVRFTKAIDIGWMPSESLLPAQFDSARAPAKPEWSLSDLDARRELARARVSAWTVENDEKPSLRFALPKSQGADLLWVYLLEAMRAIGIDAERVPLDAPADLRLLDEVAPYDSGRWYVSKACNPCGALDALIAAGRDAPDLASRATAIADADTALAVDSAFIPIAQPLRWSAAALRLRAFQANSRAWHPLNRLRAEPK